MALNGSFKSSKTGNYGYGPTGLIFSWSATQDVTNNRSTISWTLTTTHDSGDMTSGWWYKAGPINMTMTATNGLFSGTSSYSNGSRIELHGGGTQIASGTAVLTHNSNGVGSFNV